MAQTINIALLGLLLAALALGFGYGLYEFWSSEVQAQGQIPQPGPIQVPGEIQQPVPQQQAGQVMDAGGPTEGPVPTVSDGGCPKEFTEMRGDACYSG